jgi:hypothetical protein
LGVGEIIDMIVEIAGDPSIFDTSEHRLIQMMPRRLKNSTCLYVRQPMQ